MADEGKKSGKTTLDTFEEIVKRVAADNGLPRAFRDNSCPQPGHLLDYGAILAGEHECAFCLIDKLKVRFERILEGTKRADRAMAMARISGTATEALIIIENASKVGR